MKDDENMVEIEVTVSRDAAGTAYRFDYKSQSGDVSDNGDIDLRTRKKNVTLRFTLTGAEFPEEPKDAVWFARMNDDGTKEEEKSEKAPGAFHNFKRPDARTLEFVDKNDDKKRYAYALRCMVGGHTVMDDPVIINR
jgi:hypothetical protein